MAGASTQQSNENQAYGENSRNAAKNNGMSSVSAARIKNHVASLYQAYAGIIRQKNDMALYAGSMA